jgi:hypothetical protein
MDRKRLSSSFVRLSASLLVALALFTNTGCNEGSNVADNTAQRPSISQQAVDHVPQRDWSHLPQFLQDAIEVQEDIESGDLLSIDGVIGNGVGVGPDGAARIVVYTERGDVHGIPTAIKGIKTDVQNIGHVTPMGKGFTGQYTPIPCGVSIGNQNECAAGTLGCVVRNSVGGAYYLSNWHVLAGHSGNGGTICQPGLYDNRCKTNTRVDGSVNQLVPIVFDNATLNTVDCGIYSSNLTHTFGMAGGYYTPTETTAAAYPGQAVKKVGRTSGYTTGTVSVINVTLSVDYGSFGIAKYQNQIAISGSFIRAGDSGSLMVDANNNPVGLCFAGGSGTSFANDIDDVLAALGNGLHVADH